MTTVSTADPHIFANRESEARSYCRTFDVRFTKAKGSYLHTDEGDKYIDFLAGCSSLNYGHNDDDMKAALIDHITADGIAHALDMHTAVKAEFLQTFQDVILKPRGLDYQLMFTGPTGANAVEAAMKLARKVTGRHNVIAFTNGFHGVTMGALAATGNSYHREGGALPLQGVTRLPYDNYIDGVNSADVLEKMLGDASSGVDAPAAIMLETVQGEGGLNAASPEFVKRVGELAKKHGALFIIDDIQAGCGRTGTFFSFEEMGVTPDIVTMAKSISGFGLPMALTLIKSEHDVFGPAEHNGTFRGNTHAFVTATVALRKFWSDDTFQNEIKEKSELLTRRLTEFAGYFPGHKMKGRGMFQGVDVGSGETAAAVCKYCFEHGLVIETSGPNDEVVKVLAPLTTPVEVLEQGFATMLDAARIVSAAPETIAAE
ncbi:diaminobutyrate--2-oxoglutarate aminotransferase [Roseovarius sp. 22II1-1F6A]|nr:diaminobutyrate--2-oxoglutarate transaminase [Actibacterium sp.]OWU71248.1 diaminobutyrate--2-oxoglutarate aminotransferase [Roseovarius sp. 22II1-1F6A]